MSAETVNLSRFRIIKPYEMIAPAKCAVCGKFSTGTYVDFGLELDFYGVVYICVEDCFLELANLQGYHSPGQHKMAMAELEDKRQELNNAYDKIEALENALDGLRRAGYVNSVCSSDAMDAEQSAEIEGSDDPGTSDSEQGSSEQTDESGRPNLFHDDSISELLGNEFDL